MPRKTGSPAKMKQTKYLMSILVDDGLADFTHNQTYCVVGDPSGIGARGKVPQGDSNLESWCKGCSPVGGLPGKGWCQSLHNFIVHRRRHPHKVLKGSWIFVTQLNHAAVVKPQLRSPRNPGTHPYIPYHPPPPSTSLSKDILDPLLSTGCLNYANHHLDNNFHFNCHRINYDNNNFHFNFHRINYDNKNFQFNFYRLNFDKNNFHCNLHRINYGNNNFHCNFYRINYGNNNFHCNFHRINYGNNNFHCNFHRINYGYNNVHFNFHRINFGNNNFHFNLHRINYGNNNFYCNFHRINYGNNTQVNNYL